MKENVRIHIKSPSEVWTECRGRIRKEWKTAFFAALILGILIHMPTLLSDIPNHDGLDSVYFDQNMITSGRWFLTIACGFSSYFTLPWMIGLLGIFFLSLTAVALAEILEIRRTGTVICLSGLLVSFPVLASAFAYVFTMDGYMMGVLLAVLSVLFTKKYRYGYMAGGICLAFSMGIYQAYLPFAILLSMYSILVLFLENENGTSNIKKTFSYLSMGILGVSLYFILLQVLLKIQGKELASYQGISGMNRIDATNFSGIIREMYRDFFSFTLRGRVLFEHAFSLLAVLVLLLLVCIAVFNLLRKKKLWKSPWFYMVVFLFVFLIPLGTNVILMISPSVNYHLLMRYQWVLFLIFSLGFAERYIEKGMKIYPYARWMLGFSAGILILHYALVDNIAYSNLEKRYEKTYAYCLRLLDRMEQTEGYYPGIPVAMIGVVGDEQYPLTDVTERVTAPLIGISGDSLLYAAANYQAFFRHYLGVEINPIEIERIPEIYDSEEYRKMDSFPGKDSVRVVDGILYIKTENLH